MKILKCLQIHEDWWFQYCVGIMEEFPRLSPLERRAVLGRHRLVDRFCQGVYIGPGSNKTLLQCLLASIVPQESHVKQNISPNC